MYLYNNESEISFENFDKFVDLEELLIGAEFADELDFSVLPDSVKKLTVLVPEERIEMTKTDLELQLLNVDICVNKWIG